MLGGISTTTDVAFSPDSYLVDAIELTNHAGRMIDIRFIVTNFTISESIYLTSVSAKFSIQDSVNLFEEMQLIGQETIRIKLVRQDNIPGAVKKTIELQLYVTEYPLYGRVSAKQHVQVYMISAISKHAYMSQFKILSRAIKGPTSNQIFKILQNDLLVPASQITILGDPVTQFQGIIPSMKPLDAIEWLRRRTYDKDGSPFHIFESVTGGIILRSLSSLVREKTNPLYATYTDSRGFTKNPLTPEEYKQKASRILEVSSTLKLSKVSAGRNGAYASSNHFLDISTKSYIVKVFDYKKHFNTQNTLEAKSILSDKFKIQQYGVNSKEVPLNEMSQAADEFISLNAIAYSTDSTVDNYQGMGRDYIDKAKAFTENLETYIHELELFGDFTLNAGSRVKLQFPKAEDPTAKKNGAEVQDAKLYDSTFTGFYLVTGVVHNFDDTGYRCRVRVKKDSLSFKLS